MGDGWVGLVCSLAGWCHALPKPCPSINQLTHPGTCRVLRVLLNQKKKRGGIPRKEGEMPRNKKSAHILPCRIHALHRAGRRQGVGNARHGQGMGRAMAGHGTSQPTNKPIHPHQPTNQPTHPSPNQPALKVNALVNG